VTQLWTRFLTYINDEERGASMVEYALLVALIAIIAIVAVTAAGKAVSSKFDTIAKTLN
jgi:pilus assembly protein Flp/PilA